MTKRILILLLLLITVASLSVLPASAATSGNQLLVDNGDFLTDSEESEIAASLEAYSKEQNCDIVVLTLNDLSGAPFYFDGTAADYAEEYYRYYGYASDGVLVLITERDEDGDYYMHFATFGKCKKRLADDEWNAIIDDVGASVKLKHYYSSIKQLTSELNDYLKPALKWYMLPLAILIGFAIAMIIMMILRSKLKSVAMKRGAADYVRPGSMNVAVARDTYLYSTVTRTAKPKNTSSSGSSSSAGGGGRKL